MAHEARHQYQLYVIDEYKNDHCSLELPATIDSWIKDSLSYRRNDGDKQSLIENTTQTIEINANAFASVYMIKQGKGARIAPWCFEQVEKRMKEIALKLWNMVLY